MKRIALILALVLHGTFCQIESAAGADWYEDFNDTDDFGLPVSDTLNLPDPPWETYSEGNGDSVASPFFLPQIIPPGSYGGGNYSLWHADRAPSDKFLKVYSGQAEVTPFLFGIEGSTQAEFGKRWKFDLWLGPRSGTLQNQVGGYKFIHIGSGEAGVVQMSGFGDYQANVYYSDLAGGQGSAIGDLAPSNIYFRIFDDNYGSIINNTDLNQFSNVAEDGTTFVTIEIEIDCDPGGGTIKIWVNDALDMYVNTTSFTNCFRFDLGNFSLSGGTSAFMGVDNFYKYDSLKATSGTMTIGSGGSMTLGSGGTITLQ